MSTEAVTGISWFERAMAAEAEVERLRAEIAELRARLEWRPIETAPKDGTQVRLWDGKAQYQGWWDAKFDSAFNEKTEKVDYIGAWTDGTVVSWNYQENSRIDPTHWQSLPEPPKEADHAG